MSRRVQRVSLSVGSAALGQAILGVQAIGLLPLFLLAWGPRTYGRWCALTALTSYLGLMDLGGQSYIGNALAMHAAQGDWTAFKRDLSHGLSLFLLAGAGAFLLVLGLLMLALRFPVPLLNRPLQVWEAWVIGLQAPLYLLLTIPGGIYTTVYRAVGLFTRGAMVGNIFRLFGIALSAGLLLLSVPPPVYAAGMVVTGGCLTAFIVWDSRRVIAASREIQINLACAVQGWSRLRSGAWHFWLISLSQGILQHGLTLIIAAKASAEAVAVYTTHRTLASIPGYLSAFVQGPMLPEFSVLWARNQLTELRQWALGAIRIVLVATGAAGLAVAVSAPVLYPLWTGRQLALDPLLLGALIVEATLGAGWLTAGWSLLAANRHRPIAGWSVSNALLTLVLAAALLPRIGLSGVAVAGLIGDGLCGAIAYPILVSKFLNVQVRRIYREVFAGLVALVPLLMAAILAQSVFHGWGSVAAFGLLSAAIAYPSLHLALGESTAKRLLSVPGFGWIKFLRSRRSAGWADD